MKQKLKGTKVVQFKGVHHLGQLPANETHLAASRAVLPAFIRHHQPLLASMKRLTPDQLVLLAFIRCHHQLPAGKPFLPVNTLGCDGIFMISIRILRAIYSLSFDYCLQGFKKSEEGHFWIKRLEGEEDYTKDHAISSEQIVEDYYG